ncbi:hypothetical protein Tco_0672272 [Tanacetum coccineum]
MEIILDEKEVTIDVIPLAVKSLRIVNWKIHKEEKKSYYQIIRADGKSQMYMIFSHTLKSFDREDLETLYKLVKAKYKSTILVEDLDLVLWNDLKTMFEPHVEDVIYMLVEMRYPLTPPTITDMLNKKLQYKVNAAKGVNAAEGVNAASEEVSTAELESIVRMNDPNITIEEYIRLEEEKARRRGKVFNWETAKYGKIRIDEDIHNLISVKTKFPAITLINEISSEKTLSCEPTVSSLNNKVDFRISFDDFNDEDHTIIFDKNSFSYKIIYVNNLKTDSKNDNEKVNMPSLPSPKPTVSCFDDLDFFNDLENEFLAIVYNDALTSKSDLSNEPTLFPQHIDDFDLKDETSLSEYDENEQNVLYFNDLFPFNIIQPDDLKSEKDNGNNEIDIIQSSGGIENTNKLLEESHDKINKVFIMKSFVMELNVNIVTWNHFINGMLFNLIKNLYVPFGIPFDPKWYYKDGDCARILRRPSVSLKHRYDVSSLDMALPARDQRHLYLRYQGLEYNDADIVDFEKRLGRISSREIHRVEPGDSESERMILEKGDLHDYWRDISTDGDFLGPPPSYTLIRDPVPRLCHRMMAHSIVGRSQAPEKVTVTDLFYLRGLDVGSVNIPYLLARYLRRFATGRKSGALISGGQFVARLAEHFRLLTEERLRGLTDQGDQVVLAAVQAPPPPLATARTMPERMARLEEDVHEIRGALAEQREVISAIARDFSRFTVWVAGGIAQLLDFHRVTYTPYSETHVPYQRHVRCRTDSASTSVAQQDQ